MLSLLLNLAGLNGIDPATGQVLGGAGATTVKKIVKKVIKKTTKAATAAAAAATATSTPAAAPTATAAAAEAVAEVVVEDTTPSPIVEYLTSLDPVTTAIVVGLLLLVALIIYRRRFSATGQRGDTFLLLGAMGAGKTALFYQLKQGLFRETHTSMKENDDTFVVKPLEGKISSWRFVDLPGHASQLVKLDQLKSASKGVVFVVDASTPETFGKVAQFLYTLLVDPVLTARRTPFFIAINKTDRLAQHDTVASKKNTEESGSEDDEANSAVDQIAERLEKILDKTRGLQSTMSDLGGDGNETPVRMLGQEGEPFRFSHSVCPISVGGISAAKGELQDLLEFLQAQ